MGVVRSLLVALVLGVALVVLSALEKVLEIVKGDHVLHEKSTRTYLLSAGESW